MRKLRRRSPIAVMTAVALFFTLAPGANAWGRGKDKRQKKAEKVAAKSYTPGPDWEAYFRDKDGVTSEIVLPPEVNSDKDWFGLLFTEYDGPRLRLAVMPVENRTASGEGEERASGGLVEAVRILKGVTYVEVPVGALEELLTTSLYNTHRFDLVERKALGAMLAEQDFGASDRVAKPTAAQIGQIQGAEYLIFAAVNEWTPDKSRVGGGGITRRIGGVVGKKKAEVAMSFRVVDATTSKTLFATTERATSGSWSVGLGGIGGGALAGLGFEKNSPISYAVQSCINKGSYKLAMWLKDKGWSGSVMLVKDDGKVYINAGENSGLQPQTRLTVLSKGEDLVDPESGLVLGSEIEVIGSLMVTSVEEQFSVAAITEGCEGIKKGDQVRITD